MSYIALYRKYRPLKFEEVVGQEAIIKILQNSIKSGTISHAFLFSGPRGTGKTSVAKIFAKSVNCINPQNGEKCCKCEVCKAIAENDIDIIEIDAASNNGVDEIREIRSNVKIVPTVGKYKVYIIDEVHMLSIGAFNALLKTLEEPPEHVIFILATTEIQKIPLTIISRCQRFDFKKISTDSICKLLKKILKNENKIITDDVIKLIAQTCDGGVRDAINLLDQLISNGIKNPTIDDIYTLNGDVSEECIEQLFANTVSLDIPAVLSQINYFYENGKNLNFICERMILLIKNININNNVKNYFNKEMTKKLEKYKSINNETSSLIARKLIEMLGELKKTSNQKIVFEVTFLEIIENLPKNNTIEEEIIIKKEDIEQKNEFEIISREIISIRINNVLAEANKEILKKYKNKLLILNEYITNKEFNKVVNLLIVGNIIVASEKYIMFEYKKETELNMFFKNLLLIEKLLKEILDFNCKVVAITANEWINIKKEYVQNKKNGLQYKLKKEPKFEIKVEEFNRPKIAIEIFGEENIDVK